ncbi:unnamed protein product [Allacma fusca]|uniref:W2 domain-containing protein n=1 Tax=Allacma fusca TaxID=39272 RepID=A0A8J2NQG9_9HEXA|nr:unnamed protein product [Allacma fusca]
MQFDEKEKFDATGFRDQLLQGLLDCGPDLDAISKYLDGAGGSKLDYRRYGETLFDVLIAGGIIGASGVTPGDGGKLAPACVFATENNMEALRAQEQLFLKVTRRFKYLEKMFDEEIRKVYTYMKQFSKDERVKLARMTGLWICNGSLNPSVLAVIAVEHLVKDNIALDFILEVFVTWKQEKGIANVVSSLKKSGLETKMMEFFPMNKRTHEHFQTAFQDQDLGELVRLQKAQASQEVKKDLQKSVSDALAEAKPAKDIINEVKEFSQKHNLVEHEVVAIVYYLLMFTADVLSEDVIMKWYKDSHAAKGKSVFLEQMKKFIEWLQNAEEESESGEEN